MTKANLRKYRAFCTGASFWVIVNLTYYGFVPKKLDKITESLFTQLKTPSFIFLLSIAVAFIWYRFIRNSYYKFIWSSTRSLIRDEIQNIYPSMVNNSEDSDHIFWKLVDSDPSLGKKSEEIMINGLWVTTAVDSAIFSLIGILVALALCVGSYYSEPIYTLAVLGILFVVSIVLSAFLITSHYNLAVTQLRYIRTHSARLARDHL